MLYYSWRYRYYTWYSGSAYQIKTAQGMCTTPGTCAGWAVPNLYFDSQKHDIAGETRAKGIFKLANDK